MRILIFYISTLMGWAVVKASIPLGAVHFRLDVNVYAIFNFQPLSFVLDNFFWYQIVQNKIFYRDLYFKSRIF